MTPHSSNKDRLLELSVDDLLNELSQEDAVEYQQLRANDPEFDPAPTERAVGATMAALIGAGEVLPDSLKARLESDVASHFAAGPVSAFTRETSQLRERRARLRTWSGWLAAAACLLLAVGLWMQRGPEAEAPIRARSALLESGRAVVLLKWSAGGDATGSRAAGDVVWDTERQVGYMRFTGLARNDPSHEQYQLWIFDSERDERYPVDGGVFDIGADGEVVIPIHAKLPIAKATLFAVTVEKPGGVVVSDRSRIAVLAKQG